MTRLEKLTAFRSKISNKLMEFSSLREMVREAELSNVCHHRLTTILNLLIDLLAYIDTLIKWETDHV